MDNKLEIVKYFLSDKEIQQKYGLDENEVANMTMSALHAEDAQILKDLIWQLVKLVDENDISINSKASQLYRYLDNMLK